MTGGRAHDERGGEKLTFVETALEAAAVSSSTSGIVALRPHAEVVLERRGRTFLRPDDYCGWEEQERIGLANFERLHDLCARLDAIVAARIPAAAARQLLPAHWQLMDLKPLYDGISLAVLALRRLLEAERPGEVAWFDQAPTSIARSVLATLAPVVGARSSVLQPLTKPIADAGTGGWTRRVRSAIQLVDRATRREDRTDRGLRILCLDRSYSLSSIAAELRRLGHSPIDWPDRRIATPRLDLAGIWANVERDEVVRSAFVFDEVDFWAAAAPRLRAVLERATLDAVAHDAAARELIDSTRPDAVLTSLAAWAREKAVCHAARASGVPVIVARHGELGTRDVPMVAHQDVASVDWALCWGSWEAAWTARHAPQPVRTVVVGAPMIEEAVQQAPTRDETRSALGIDAGTRLVLYAPTGLTGDDWYASRRAPPDSVYFRQETRVVQALAAIDGARLVVKEHPYARPTPLERWCDGLANVELLYEPAFSSLVHAADLIVLDAPSTTLVEALFGTAPIYIVDHPVYAWEPGVREHLIAHGVAFTDAEHLAADIRAGRAKGDYTPEAREPLIAGGDGTAAARAALAIAEIAGGLTG